MSITMTTVASVTAGILGIASAVGLLWKPVRIIRIFFHGLARAMEAIHGRPAEGNFPAVPGLLARVDSIGAMSTQNAESMAIIRHEVLPNNGGSIKDAVTRLEIAVGATGIRLDTAQTDRHDQTTDIKSDIARLSGRLDQHIDQHATPRPSQPRPPKNIS